MYYNIIITSEKENMNMLTINGEINDVMAASLIRQILDISDRNPKETITIYISSKGGKVTAGMAIYDVISFVPNPINTIAKGKVASNETFIDVDCAKKCGLIDKII